VDPTDNDSRCGERGKGRGSRRTISNKSRVNEKGR
jgi:hypothetical protein